MMMRVLRRILDNTDAEIWWWSWVWSFEPRFKDFTARFLDTVTVPLFLTRSSWLCDGREPWRKSWSDANTQAPGESVFPRIGPFWTGEITVYAFDMRMRNARLPSSFFGRWITEYRCENRKEKNMLTGVAVAPNRLVHVSSVHGYYTTFWFFQQWIDRYTQQRI